MTKHVKRISVIIFTVLVLVFGAILGACGGNPKIEFETNGGTEIASIEEAAGTDITEKLPADPVKDGYHFAGWYANKDLSGDAAELPTVMPEKSMKFYAKWDAKAVSKLTLVAGEGGTLATTEYDVEEGTVLKTFLSGKEPTVTTEKLSFGAWFNGNNEIADDFAMPASALTLTARYKAAYTVHLFVEKDGVYPQTSVEIAGSGWWKQAFVFEPGAEYEHYEFDTAHEGFSASSDSLAPGAEFNVYLKGQSLSVSYLPNEPEDVTINGEMASGTYAYGDSVTLPECTYVSPANYRFAGWSTSPRGPVEYQAGATIEKLEDDLTLFAIWTRGYTDRFGGSDMLFIEDTAEGKQAVIVRNGEERVGAVGDDGTSFRVVLKKGSNTTDPIELKGEIRGTTFAYVHELFEGVYTLFDNHYVGHHQSGEEFVPGPVETTTLELIGAQTAVYTVDGEALTGVFYPDAQTGHLVFEAEGVQFEFDLAYSENTQTMERIDIFVVCGAEEGTYEQFIPREVDGGNMSGSVGGLEIYLDGTGMAYLTDGDYEIEGYYCSTESDAYSEYTAIFADIYGLIGEEMTYVTVTFRTTTLTGGSGLVSAFTLRNDSAMGTFTGTYDEKKVDFKFDGYTEVEVIENGTPVSAFFTAADTMFGTVATVVVDNTAKTTYIVNLKANDDGTQTYEKFGEIAEYREIRYLTAEETQQSSGNFLLRYVLVLFGEDVTDTADTSKVLGTRAAIYYETTDGFKLLSEGYYTVEENGLFKKYVETTAHNDVTVGGEQITYFKEFKFRETELLSPNVYFVYSGKESAEEDEQLFYTKITTENEGSIYIYDRVKITGLGGLYIDKDKNVYEGSFAKAESAAFTLYDYFKDKTYYKFVSVDLDDDIYFVVTTTGETSSFKKAPFVPYGVGLGDENGNFVDNLVFYFLDETNALYFKSSADALLHDGGVMGTYTLKNEVTVFGDDIYSFTPSGSDSDVTAFDFVLEDTTSESYFSGTIKITYLHKKYTESKVFTAEDGGLFTIDGFGYRATYENAEGETIEGTAYMRDPELFIGDEGMFSLAWGMTETEAPACKTLFCLFDEYGIVHYVFIDEHDNIVVADETLGSQIGGGMFMLTDECYVLYEGGEIMVLFNGFGTVTLMGETGDGDEIFETGTYTLVNAETSEYRLSVVDAEEAEKEYLVRLDFGELYCLVYSEAKDVRYVSEKWEMVDIDGFGYGTYTTKDGVVYGITYTTLDENYMALTLYNGEKVDSELVVKYSDTTKTFATIDNSDYVGLWVAPDLSPVFFDGEAKAYINGMSAYYVVVDGTVQLYYANHLEAALTKYTVLYPDETGGFVVQDGSTITLYQQVPSEGITLIDPEYSTSSITYSLSFVPQATTEYTVAASFLSEDLDGDYGVQVIAGKPGETKTYLLYGDGSRFEIKVNAAKGTFTFITAPTDTVSTVYDYAYRSGEIDLPNTIGFVRPTYGAVYVGYKTGEGTVQGNFRSVLGTDGKALTFSADYADIEATQYGSEYFGRLYELQFTGSDNAIYVLDFYMTSMKGIQIFIVETLTRLTTFEDITSGSETYRVNIGQVVYTDPTIFGYDPVEFPKGIKIGQIMSAGLFVKDADGETYTYLTPTGALDVADDGKTVTWVVETAEKVTTYTIAITYKTGEGSVETTEIASVAVTKSEKDTEEVSETYSDYMFLAGEEKSISTLTVTTKGGKITKVAGTLQYTGASMTFESTQVAIAGQNSKYGYRFSVDFTVKEKKYNIQFFLVSTTSSSGTPQTSFLLYSLNQVFEKEVQGTDTDSSTTYKVGIYQSIYANAFNVTSKAIMSASFSVKSGDGNFTPLSPDDTYLENTGTTEAPVYTIVWITETEAGGKKQLTTYTIVYTFGKDGLVSDIKSVTKKGPEDVQSVTYPRKTETVAAEDAGMTEVQDTITIVNGATKTVSGSLKSIKDSKGNPIEFENADLYTLSKEDSMGLQHYTFVTGKDGRDYLIVFYPHDATEEKDGQPKTEAYFTLYAVYTDVIFAASGSSTTVQVEVQQLWVKGEAAANDPKFDPTLEQGDIDSVTMYLNGSELTLLPETYGTCMSDDGSVFIYVGTPDYNSLYTYMLTFTFDESKFVDSLSIQQVRGVAIVGDKSTGLFAQVVFDANYNIVFVCSVGTAGEDGYYVPDEDATITMTKDGLFVATIDGKTYALCRAFGQEPDEDGTLQDVIYVLFIEPNVLQKVE